MKLETRKAHQNILHVLEAACAVAAARAGAEVSSKP